METIVKTKKMALHYSKYSSVLEIEKVLLGIELSRVGKMLTKSQEEKRGFRKKLEELQSSSSENIHSLSENLKSKVI